ncbi:unnamed protein product [Macrosiphum euphorbiae]|uniref:Uncharacterized protein n=1 Tax=Macrosiphum euphorbiae TaxID=13131 RepID=A0AAV0X0J8_9HEMI|nr:unnamed protein product [Macrosiphum euphorbiae]
MSGTRSNGPCSRQMEDIRGCRTSAVAERTVLVVPGAQRSVASVRLIKNHLIGTPADTCTAIVENPCERGRGRGERRKKFRGGF